MVGPFAELLKETLGWDTTAPYSGTIYDLTNNVCLYEAEPKPIPHKSEEQKKSEGAIRAETIYGHLLTALDHLVALVKRSEGRPNKELKRLSGDIEELVRKYE